MQERVAFDLGELDNSDLKTFSAILGTLSAAQPTIQASGTATVIYTATGAGAGSVNAVVDNVPGADLTARASITASNPVVTNPATTTGTAGIAFSQTFTQSGAIGGATFTIKIEEHTSELQSPC